MKPRKSLEKRLDARAAGPAKKGPKVPTSPDGTPLFRQGDPAWGSRVLGNHRTIAVAGCAMTATAMAISKLSGKVINPAQLDAHLDKHGGYSGDALVWDKAAKARSLHAKKAAFGLDTINKQLAAGRPVVVGVDYRAGSGGGGGGTDHWITVTARGKEGSHPVYFANDPASGKRITVHGQGGRLVGGPRKYKTTGELVVFSGGHPSKPGSPPPHTHPTPPPSGKGLTLPSNDLKRGSGSGPDVRQLQKALVMFSVLSKANMATGPGIFGAKTEAALKRFQAAHHVPPTGYYGPLTRKAFQKLGASVSSPSPSPGGGGGGGGLSVEKLKKIMPHLPDAKARQYLPHLNRAMAEAKINTRMRQAAFLAQLAHESGGLHYMEEIASGAAYEGRKDLGNTEPGDGKRFKGRGPIQLTGRTNYRAAGKALGINLVSHPTRAKDPDVGFRSAGWFWTQHRLNRLADAGNFREITHKINGGYNGEASREAYYRKALSALSRGVRSTLEEKTGSNRRPAQERTAA